MNAKHRKTFEAIFKDPVQGGIEWRDIEKMFFAMGAKISEGSGSRVRVKLNGVRAVFHRPHPQKNACKGAVKAVRIFLKNSEAKL